MEKRLSSSAGFLALLAVLIHTFGNSDAEKARTPQNQRAALQVPSVQRHTLACPGKSQGPWPATQQYFHSAQTDGSSKNQTCLSRPNERCIRSTLLSLYGFPADFPEQNIHALIATVLDPLHTRVALETDRYLDAIQQAAFRAGWELAKQWVPWTVKAEADQNRNHLIRKASMSRSSRVYWHSRL